MPPRAADLRLYRADQASPTGAHRHVTEDSSSGLPLARSPAEMEADDRIAAFCWLLMWQPNRAQWSIIWTVAVLLLLVWPPDKGRSLAVKALNWAVDPRDALPDLPVPLPMSLDDDGDAVAAHDALEAEYYRRRDSSTAARWRMTMKMAADPLDPLTERQLLVGVAVLSALAVWRLNKGVDDAKEAAKPPSR